MKRCLLPIELGLIDTSFCSGQQQLTQRRSNVDFVDSCRFSAGIFSQPPKYEQGKRDTRRNDIY